MFHTYSYVHRHRRASASLEMGIIGKTLMFLSLCLDSGWEGVGRIGCPL